MTPDSAGLRSALEVERKYDVPRRTVVPDLAGVPGVAAVSEPETLLLDATYYDTDDLRLRSAGITLRRRTGGADAGWHLKLPAGADRQELTADLGDESVPDALVALVRARVRERGLAPVARLTTRRVVRRLLDGGGSVLAELADDGVTGRALPAGIPDAWREWELELVTGDRGLLSTVDTVLSAAGAVPSSSGSKLGRVLPLPGREPRLPAEESGTATRRGRRTAGDAVQEHLAEQVAELVARDPQARRDLPDAVHKMRVATRRLRSALATFRPLLDRARTDPLRSELRWLAGLLGAARDAEVMQARLRALITAEPPDLVLGPVQDRVDRFLAQRHQEAHARLLVELDGGRYLALLDALDALVAAPPFTRRAGRGAERELRRAVRRSWRRLRRTMRAAGRPAAAHRVALLHEVRKEAKRARYAAEAVRPVLGEPAGRFAAAMASMQEALGELQDGQVTMDLLRQLGSRGHLAGENAFTLGRLHAAEQARAERAAEQWPALRAAASRRRLRAWLG